MLIGTLGDPNPRACIQPDFLADYLESHLNASAAERLGRGLRGFELGNFKAFGETQSIPIRPLNLIFGANSSGKSTIIHSLLLANHGSETGNFDVQIPRMAGGGR